MRLRAPCAELFPYSTLFRSWLGPLEGYVLYRLARDGEGKGEIVEIGSWMGRSTAWLAAGSRARGRERVHAVDTLEGDTAEHPSLWPLVYQHGTDYKVFLDNL